MRNIDLAIKNFRHILKTNPIIVDSPKQLIEFCLQNTLEMKALREKMIALDEIGQAKKEKREPSLTSWHRLKQAKEFLENSNKEYLKGPWSKMETVGGENA